MIDRLEQAGYVRRVPDAADRRRVVVELVPEKMEAMEATMARYGDKSAAEMKRYSDAELAVINDFLTRMADVTRDEANALRDAPDREAGAPSEYAAPIGGLSRARLLFRSGANELLVRGSTDFDDLYRAKFDGPVPQVRLRDGIVTIQYKGRLQWDWRAAAGRRGAQRGRAVGRRGRRRGQQAPGQAGLGRPAVVRDDRRRRPAPADARAADRRWSRSASSVGRITSASSARPASMSS